MDKRAVNYSIYLICDNVRSTSYCFPDNEPYIKCSVKAETIKAIRS